MDENATNAFQRENAEAVKRHIRRLKARQMKYMGVGAIAGLLLGLALGYAIILSLDQTINWIRLGPTCMIIGILVAAFMSRMRPKDMAAITRDIARPPSDLTKR